MYIYFIIVFSVTFSLTALLCRLFIPVLKGHKVGQKILDIGPSWHKSKENTPTMGGIFFVAASVSATAAAAFFAFYGKEFPARLFLTLFLCFAMSAVGIVDDLTKLRRKSNGGLSAAAKFILQLAVAAIYLLMSALFCDINTVLALPFTGTSVDLGIFYYIIMLILICGVVNSVNLTDGIDGLASSVTGFVGVFFAAAALFYGYDDAVLLSAAIIGGCAGFLIFNFHPARVFMGDTGSLFLGAAVVSMAILCGSPLISLLIGIVYIIETLSVIIQVSVYKLTKKRVFRMAPIHHHFEKCGASENQIVLVACLITVAAGVIAWFGL
ncbi:MAG: phospho-N-acetylmuramoyl-pentapeptide-transferase [Clostridia bacterium]|nr:phospho-N-acetylmuramoyl-pentapeptide-transferase [Clostridia bacterium]